MEEEKLTYGSPGQSYREGAKLYSSCQYHVLFCTYKNLPLLDKECGAVLGEFLNADAREQDIRIRSMVISPDAVQFLADCPADFNIFRYVNHVKKASAHCLYEAFPALKSRTSAIWTRKAFVSTVGIVAVEETEQYITAQKYRKLRRKEDGEK